VRRERLKKAVASRKGSQTVEGSQTYSKHTRAYKSFTTESFADRILDHCNHSFSSMYYYIFKKYWHTHLEARMPRGYFVTNRNMGIYEVYIPTRSNRNVNMQYYRIVIKVVSELDHDLVKAESKTVRIRQVQPNGIVDSELICLIAPKRSEKAREERQFLRGFRHIKKQGYLTAIIINPVPEICMKRLLMLIATFLKRRLKKLLEKLNFQPWQYDYRRGEHFYYSYLATIIESFSYSIAQTLRCFSHSYAWIRKQLKRVMYEIGRQSLVRVKLKKLEKVKALFKALNMPISQEVREKEAKLLSDAKNCYWVKPPLTHEEWKKHTPRVKLKLNALEEAILRISKEGDSK